MMNTHHLILGTLRDFLSGEEIADTHDERYRQKIARFLVEEKGFRRDDIKAGNRLVVSASGKKAMITVDFLVYAGGKTMMLIKYGPGSIITRHRPALAASRLMADYQIPVVVVTNGEEADILCGHSGKIRGMGFESIPGNDELLGMSEQEDQMICAKRKELESRIIYAFEVDGSCPCDSDICRIES
jgi:hypothetical protein